MRSDSHFFELAVTRSLMLCNVKIIAEFDALASTQYEGVSEQALAGVARLMTYGAMDLPGYRRERVTHLLKGGLIERLKTEAMKLKGNKQTTP